jgi:hypothetical protein
MKVYFKYINNKEVLINIDLNHKIYDLNQYITNIITSDHYDPMSDLILEKMNNKNKIFILPNILKKANHLYIIAKNYKDGYIINFFKTKKESNQWLKL